jgi:hypothetical protein
MIYQRLFIQCTFVSFFVLISCCLFIWHYTHPQIASQKQAIPPTLPHLISPVQANEIQHPIKSIQIKQCHIQFQTRQSHLPDNEQQRLINTIKQWQLNRTSHIDIHISLFSHDSNITTPQLAKLRAQTIARLFFPHTQNINIHLNTQPNNKMDTHNNVALIQLHAPHVKPQHMTDTKPL